MPTLRRAARRTGRRTARRASRRMEAARSTDEAQAPQEPAAQAPAAQAPAPREPGPRAAPEADPEDALAQRLRELDELHESGVLTDEQFEQAMNRIVDSE